MTAAMAAELVPSRLFAGPALRGGAEPYRGHLERLGDLPPRVDPQDLIATIEAAGLLGRGGAGFPVARKWRSVAERAAGGGAVVLANGAEGEPLSAKDRTLMALRPHLILDGAELAADAVGADEIVLYVGQAHLEARQALDRALAERSAARSMARGRDRRVPVRLVAAPDRYVAGEASAAVHFVNAGDARPTTTPPRPFEAGVHGRPTLVQNVESLAHAALIGRFGDGWYREAGRGPTRGTGLVTVTGTSRPGVREIELGTTVAEVAAGVGAQYADVQAVLLGGYFGGWVDRDEAWSLALDPATVRESARSFGCGVVSLLPHDACGVRATARIADYMAGQSAAQCGPCVFGLRAIADATERIARGAAGVDDLDRVERWASQLAGRGACRHPDGAVGLLKSALDLFGEEFRLHQRSRRCSRIEHPAVAA